MASVGQFLAQAPHSMQPSKSTMRAFLLSIENMPCGQTITHIPQPTQALESNVNVVTPGRYLNVSIYSQSNFRLSRTRTSTTTRTSQTRSSSSSFSSSTVIFNQQMPSQPRRPMLSAGLMPAAEWPCAFPSLPLRVR